MKVHIRLQEILEERKISQAEIARKTKLRKATISEMCNNQRSVINKDHLVLIAEALGITNIEDIMSFIETEEQK